ncbi:MAG: acyl-CoA desaturase [Bryobacteraceae bacterium]
MMMTDASVRKSGKINWVTTIAMSIFHIGAVAAFFFFDWTALVVAVVVHWVAICFGIGMGYHRLHTHRSYKVPKPLEYFLAVCGTLALEGGPISWVGTHRIHHQKSDQPGDPHSPRDGALWAHLWWMFVGEPLHNNTPLMSRYAPDLARDPFYVWLNDWHWVPLTVLGLTFAVVGGLPLVLWAIFLRVVLGLHFTWAVNSATHMWGERRFNTRDDSRNNWWVALLTFGEGWHITIMRILRRRATACSTSSISHGCISMLCVRLELPGTSR